VTHASALAIRNHDHAPGKKAVANDPTLTVVPARVLNLNRLSREDLRGVEKVEPARRQGALPFRGIERDAHGLM